MANETSEQLGIQGLGWIVRRGMQLPPEMVPFYKAAWGLNAPRGPGPTGAMMLWGGDLTMFEVSTLTPGASTASRAGEMSVVMATSDLPMSLRRMQDAGASLISEQTGPPARAMVADPEGRLLGLLEVEDRAATDPGQLVAVDAHLPGDLDGVLDDPRRVTEGLIVAEV